MFGKFASVVLFAIFSTCEGTLTDDVWTGNRVKWGFNFLGLNNDFDYEIPQTFDDAVAQGWTEVTGATNLPDLMALAFEGDITYSVFYNTTTLEYEGFQVAIPAEGSDKLNLPMDYNNFNGITPKYLGNTAKNRTEKCYTAAIRTHINEDGSHKIWWENNSEWHEVPSKASEMVATTPWSKKNCIASMGIHYYRLNSTSTSYDFHPWSFLVVGDEVVGFLCQIIGKTDETGKSKFPEAFPIVVIPFVIPDAPWSLYTNVWNYGVVSIHSWRHKDPQSIGC